MRLVVTLLHGTFAKNATWVDDSGSIAVALKARFGDSVGIERLRWSGANSFEGRREATGLLRTHILGGAGEDVMHVVVAHSHAGNVVAYAARDPEVGARLAGVVTMATPFIVARKRNLGHVGFAIGQALVLWLVLALYWFASSWLGPLLGSAPAAELTAGYKVALIVGLVLLVEVPGLLLAAAARRSSALLLDELALAPLTRERMLILRAMADEASAVITFLQLPSMLSTLVFGRFARAADAVVDWAGRTVKRPLLAFGAYVLLFVASLLPAWLVLWATGSQPLMYVVLIGLMCLSYGPLVFMMLRNRHLAYVTVAGSLAIPMAPVLVVIALAAGLAYGKRFAPAILDLDVSVESTPIGAYLLTLLSPAAASDPDRAGGLLHSVLYDDERAIGLICDFVADRMPPPV